MAFDNAINRGDAAALVPEEVSNAMLKKLSETSAALSQFTCVPISRNQERFPVLSALPIAYFVEGDTGLKQTSEAKWKNKFLNVSEIACIVPIPEAVLDDTEFDIWGQIKPLMETAIGRTLDQAVFFSVNKPATWPKAIAEEAIAAGNEITRGKNEAKTGGIVGDFSDLFEKVELDGYDVDWAVAKRNYKGLLRQARATTGESLLATREVHGVTVQFPMKGLWPSAGSHPVEAIVGDPEEQVVGVRQDITYKMLDEAVIQDAEGKIVFNLAQQDMVAMRVVFRAGWETANTINYENENDATRYPAAVMLAT